MNEKTQVVLRKLEELKAALIDANAAESSGWIRALFAAVESAQRDAITAEAVEAGAAAITAEREAKDPTNRR